jgi:hypothetical protein
VAYDTQKALMGREPVAIVEIDFPICSLTYGSSPCTASGAAGTECFNSFSTCQDQDNYAAATKTFRFSSVRIDGLQGTTEAPTFPTVTAISTAPTILTPGKGLGVRSKCSVSLVDHPWTDVGIDNYISNRTYDADSQGSFWAKQINRFPFYENLEMRVKTGYLADDGTYDASNFVTRTYFVDTIKGPSDSGKITIVGKDVLKFADGEKANLPTQSQATLDENITVGALSFDITDPKDNIKDAYDDVDNVGASQCYIRIDDETMLVTNMTGTTPDYTLTVTRAAMPAVYSGTITAETHDKEATVQDCYLYDSEEVDDIVQHLLENIAGINSSYLDKAGWQDVIDFGLQSYTFTALITEPTPVKKLLQEITEHTILLWWDEREAKVKMDSIIRRANDYGPFDDDQHLVAGSVSIARDDKSRVSQFWIHYGLRTPVIEMNETKNFSVVKVSADLDAETSKEYGQQRIKKVFSRWLSLDNEAIASEIANRYVNDYRDTKHVITGTLDPKDDDAWTGNRVSIKTRQIQDRFGASVDKNYRILQVSEKMSKGAFQYQYVMESTGGIYDGSGPSIYGVITPDLDPGDGVSAFPDYTSASVELKSKYAFIAKDDRGDGKPGFSPNEKPYVIV